MNQYKKRSQDEAGICCACHLLNKLFYLAGDGEVVTQDVQRWNEITPLHEFPQRAAWQR